MPLIQLPAGQVAAGHLPPVCPRHGAPATESKSVKLISKPPPWAAVFILGGGILYLIVVLAVRKSVKAPMWPWCAQCSATRKKLLTIGLPMIGVAVLCWVAAIALNNDTSGVIFLLGFILLLAGIIVAARGGTVPVTGALVSGDGQLVEIKKGSDQFLHALRGGNARV